MKQLKTWKDVLIIFWTSSALPEHLGVMEEHMTGGDVDYDLRLGVVLLLVHQQQNLGYCTVLVFSDLVLTHLMVGFLLVQHTGYRRH